MIRSIIFVSVFLFVTVETSFAQNNQSVNSNRTQNPLESIAEEITRIAKSVETLNKRLENFSQTFTSNQGLRLTDRQQKILIAFEFLNRAEQRLSILQKSKIELTEKQSSARVALAKIDEELLPETIDRGIAVGGSTNAEQVREIRRQVLYKEKAELNNLLIEIQRTLYETNNEIRQTDNFLKNIRQRLFPEIEREISDL
jgi:uncharacterized protein YlxW (UPF0749 family)